MISVLQKIEFLFQTGKISLKSIKAEIEGDDEIACFKMAVNRYFLVDIGGNLISGLTDAGQKELHRLLTIKKTMARQDQQYDLQVRIADIEAQNLIINRRRDQREFWTFIISIISLGVAIGSLVVSFIALHVALS